MREARVPSAARCVLRQTARVERPADGRVALAVQLTRAPEPLVVRLGAEDPRTARVARRHVDVLFIRCHAELGEPEAVLLDEVDCEAIAAGRDRRAQRERLAQGLAGLDGALERSPDAVPDDRVPALVEPVIRQEEAVLDATCPPRRGAGVVDLHRDVLERTGFDRGALERPPACDERAHDRG